jgi:hypothetical protein
MTVDHVRGDAYISSGMGFTKLFSSLVHSTVWREEMHVKVVWVTMLALANRHGDVLASVPGLADAARVSLEQCVDALEKFKAPDPWSRTKTHEGRRVIEVDGGWNLLNYPKYREIRDADERRIQTREAVRRHRARKAKSLTVSTVSPDKPPKAQAEAEAEAETTSASPPTNGGASTRANWITPFAQAWERLNGKANYGELGKHLGSLCRPQGVYLHADVVRAWERYLGEVEGRYASAAHFVKTHRTWGLGSPPRRSIGPHTQTADEADRRAGIALPRDPQ